MKQTRINRMNWAYLKENFLEEVISEMGLERWVEYTENVRDWSVALDREPRHWEGYILGMNKVQQNL